MLRAYLVMANLRSVIEYPRTEKCFRNWSTVEYFGKFLTIILVLLVAAVPVEEAGLKSSVKVILPGYPFAIAVIIMDRLSDFQELLESKRTNEANDNTVLLRNRLKKSPAPPSDSSKAEDSSFLSECMLIVVIVSCIMQFIYYFVEFNFASTFGTDKKSFTATGANFLFHCKKPK
jgi:hypothetical protein